MRFYPYSPSPSPSAVRLAWSSFVTGEDPHPPAVRSHVLRAWQRSRSAGLDPTLPRADRLSGAETEALLGRERRLIDVATPFLVALSRAAGEYRHAAMLADGTGRLLKIVGDAETVEDEDFPHPGALLSEQMAGANGVGTAIAEGHYTELVGPEHYIEGFHAFTCQGVPLTGDEGECRGVLSVSVRKVEAATRLRDILFCASEAAECELLAAWLSRDLSPRQPVPIVESLRQDMIQRLAVARLQLEFAARQIAAGADASTTIEAARVLEAKFQRQAMIWRDLVDPAPAEVQRLRLADVVEDFMELVTTEARIAGVTLGWGRTEDVQVLEDRRALARQLLAGFLDVLQRSVPGSRIVVDVGREAGTGGARVAWREDRHSHGPHIGTDAKPRNSG